MELPSATAKAPGRRRRLPDIKSGKGPWFRDIEGIEDLKSVQSRVFHA